MRQNFGIKITEQEDIPPASVDMETGREHGVDQRMGSSACHPTVYPGTMDNFFLSSNEGIPNRIFVWTGVTGVQPADGIHRVHEWR